MKYRPWRCPAAIASILASAAVTSCSSDDPSFTEQRSSRNVSVAVEGTSGSSADAKAETAAPSGAVDWTRDTVASADTTPDDLAPGTETLGDVSGTDGEGSAPGDEVLADLPDSDAGATDACSVNCGAHDGLSNDGGMADGGMADGGMADGGMADGSGSDGGITDGGGTADGGTDGSGSDGGVADGTTDGGSTDGGSTDDDTDPDIKACASAQGVAASRVKIAGNQPNVKIESDSVMAIKVTGNQPTVELSLFGATLDAKLAGLCVFLAGNKAKINVFFGVDVGRLVYFGRGNQSQGDVAVQEGMTLDTLTGDLAGNQAWLNLHGRGSHPCETVRLRGHDAGFTCE